LLGDKKREFGGLGWNFAKTKVSGGKGNVLERKTGEQNGKGKTLKSAPKKDKYSAT